MVNGKAKLVDKNHCDGLGRCLPQCPVDAISLEEIDLVDVSEPVVEKQEFPPMKCGCPGTMVRTITPKTETNPNTHSIPSALEQWPIQLHLVSETAPYFKNAALLIAADCTAFSYGAFHRDFIAHKRMVMCCPKLDDTSSYVEKLAAIILHNDLKSIDVVYMQVPCCHALVTIVKGALKRAKPKKLNVTFTELSLEGEILNQKTERLNDD